MSQESNVTPVIIPYISWDVFLTDVSDSIGHSPTRSVDESGQKLSVYAKFLTTLQEFRTDSVANPIDVLRDANLLLDHLAFSFLIEGSNIMVLQLLELTSLSGVSTKANKGRAVLLSGTLSAWKLATIDLCNAKRVDLRRVGKTLLELFAELGLKNIFANFDSKIRPDGTLLLTYKP